MKASVSALVSGSKASASPRSRLRKPRAHPWYSVVNYRINKVENDQKQSSDVITPAANAISSSSMLLLAMISNTSDARRTHSTGLTNVVSTDKLYRPVEHSRKV
jgi:hypothetical protein